MGLLTNSDEGRNNIGEFDTKNRYMKNINQYSINNNNEYKCERKVMPDKYVQWYVYSFKQ